MCVWVKFEETVLIASDLVDPRSDLNQIHVAPNHIEGWTGRRFEKSTVGRDEVISSKHQFHVRQVIYSKIRPNLAKAIVANFDGVCSADMYPLSFRGNPRLSAA